MPREAVSFVVPDLSAFARSLARALAERETTERPGHVEMLNLIARAAGHRNVMALRASLTAPAAPLAAEDRAPAVLLSEHARRVLRLFDTRGRMIRLPGKYSLLKLALWVLWTRFDARRVYTEKQVNAVLMAANTFGDHVTLRRELIDHRLLARESDGSKYWKLAARPDDETRALLAAWRARERQRSRAPVAAKEEPGLH